MSLERKIVVFSGFRDAALTKKIEELQGTVKATLVKDSNILIYKKDGKPGSKIDKAKEMGIEVIEVEDFKKKYFLTPKPQCYDLSKYESDYINNEYQPTF